MTEDCTDAGKPDIEDIMAGIRRDLDAAGGLAPGEPPVELGEEAGLHDNLAEANRLHAVGNVSGSGPAAAVQRVSHKMVGPLIGQINDFNARVVRVLNEVVRMLEGEETASTGRILQEGKRRTELLSQLSERAAELDALKIDERLRSLEDQVKQLSSREEP